MTEPLPLLRLAVVGHTNTGKTSLLRTLTRNVDFGEVSPHPATTRHVEGTSILLEGTKVLELYDTPGLEDSIGLLDHLDGLAKGRRDERLEVIREFLESRPALKRFAQEAKAIRQVLDCDAALYVVDARDRVLGKHRDELEILARCAAPVVPVLNFTADPDAQVPLWRDQLARVNMHVVAEFDTVVLDELSEQRLFEKMRTLLDAHAPTLTALADERRRLRDALVRASADLAAELLVDVAAHVVPVPVDQAESVGREVETLRQRVRDREQQCVEQLLQLHQFHPDDYRPESLPLVNGRWGLDLFSPEALKQFGVSTGGAAATGALVGLVLDAMTLGTSLGTLTAAGATVGGLIGAGRTHGRRLLDRLRGMSELRCDDGTLRLLALRQIMLIQALLHRGHAAVTPVGGPEPDRLDAARQRSTKGLPAALEQARTRPHWSRLDQGAPARAPDPGRDAARAALARLLARILHRPPDTPLEFP
jgi:GTP-binding protein EngB required for normal cell division